MCCSGKDSVVCAQDCRMGILDSAPRYSMAGETIETGEPRGPEESKPSSPCRGWCCPHCVLEISHEAPLEDGRKKVEDAISNWEAQTEDEWILHMKMCAYLALLKKQEANHKDYVIIQAVQKIGNAKRVQWDRPGIRVTATPSATPTTTTNSDRPEPTTPGHSADGFSAPEKKTRMTQAGTGEGEVASSSGQQPDVAQQIDVGKEKTETSLKRVHWQVMKGKKKNRKWGDVEEDLSKHLEEAFQAQEKETTFNLTVGTYHYDMKDMIQTSPLQWETKRRIRRLSE